MIDGLPKSDYEIYKKIRASGNQKNAIETRNRVTSIYEKVQNLVKQGKNDQAQKLVDGLTDDEYKAYQRIKKSSAQ